MPDSIPVLSDHAYQSSNFEIVDPHTGAIFFNLNVGTWNMQDLCFSKKNHATHLFSNNPYDADETQGNYEIRKRAQFSKIAQNIGANGDAVVLLQEVDFLLAEKHTHLKDEFIAMLRVHGYELVLTTRPADHNYTQQPMALIYDTKKLVCAPESIPLFAAPPDFRGKSKYRGYETIFTDLRSKIVFAVANIHLPYGHDNYTSEIYAHQMDLMRRGIPSIVGGDTNRPPPANLWTSSTDGRIATNFSRDPATGKLITEEDVPGYPGFVFPKAYDRFFAAASGMVTHMTARSEQVSIDADGNAVFSPAVKYQTPRHDYFFKAAALQAAPDAMVYDAEPHYVVVK